MLPVMDWIFGTAHLARKQWPSAYGVATKLPGTLAGQLIYPFLPQSPPAAMSPEREARR